MIHKDMINVDSIMFGSYPTPFYLNHKAYKWRKYDANGISAINFTLPSTKVDTAQKFGNRVLINYKNLILDTRTNFEFTLPNVNDIMSMQIDYTQYKATDVLWDMPTPVINNDATLTAIEKLSSNFLALNLRTGT
jgi:hypothetical protein